MLSPRSLFPRLQSEEPMQVDGAGGEAPANPMQMQLLSFTVENPSLVGLVGGCLNYSVVMEFDDFRIWMHTLAVTVAWSS